ncbi:hypothetical protein OUZ56_032769 [Daphnia magna]|uniref:Uncharacterized protein n=1 Tax=Daphnia magna TaxID=35525 RepID=A0ABQ9ZX23_9CRUS|nr:hypothetical protein OUZ56_032769 [Daphnia magna]
MDDLMPDIESSVETEDQFRKHIAIQTNTGEQQESVNDYEHDVTEKNNSMKDTEGESSGSQNDATSTPPRIETSLNDTIELDDTITGDDETTSLTEARSLSTELGHYLSDDALDEYFVNRNAFPSVTHNPDGTPNWENTFALTRCVRWITQSAGDSERRWTPCGLPPLTWPLVSYSRCRTWNCSHQKPPRRLRLIWLLHVRAGQAT